MPESGASDNDQEILSGGADLLKEAFSSMFKESQNCRRPFLNIDKLRNDLHQVNSKTCVSMYVSMYVCVCMHISSELRNDLHQVSSLKKALACVCFCACVCLCLFAFACVCFRLASIHTCANVRV